MAKAPESTTDASKAPSKPAPANKTNVLDRWECTVYATDPSASKVFKLNIPHPTRDVPLLVEGRHGVLIKEGLTAFTIKCLEKAYNNVMVELSDAEVKAQGDVGITHKRIRVPMYRVDKGKKIVNPKPVGKGGK